MIETTVHTYGYFDALYYVIQSLAMFRNAGFYGILVNATALLTGTYYAVRIAASPNSYRVYLYKIFGMVVLINALLMPTTEMIIKDHVTKKIGKVDHVPVAFAVPVGILENLGYMITRGFEQAFSPFSSGEHFDYFNYGMLFGARLKKELSTVRIKDPEFVGNMQKFIVRCVSIPAQIGYQFTKEKLMATDDMWKLVKDNAGELTGIDINIGSEKEFMSCKEAANYFETNYWPEEQKRIFAKFKESDFALASSSETYTNIGAAASTNLNNNLKNNIKTIYGGTRSAENALKQQMMIDSLSNFTSNTYSVSRARMQQEASFLLSSDMASLYLPMLLVVFKCIVYGSFIFLVPLVIVSGGISKYRSYLIIVLSLQLWPALNAILNMIIETYSNLPKGSDMLISFSTVSSINKRVDTIVSVAGGMQIGVPAMAIWLTNMGVHGLSSMGGNILGGLQSVSGAIAGESVTNNRSLDNHNIGNTQMHSKGGFKTDTNRQYFDGVNHGMHGDGTIERVNPDGRSIFTAGAGTTASSGSTSYRSDKSRIAQVNKGMQEVNSLNAQNSRSFSDSKSNTFVRTGDYVAHIAEREHNGESFNYDSLGEQGKDLRQAVNHTKQLHDKKGYGFSQAANATLEASITGKTPDILPVSASVSVKGSVGATNSSDQSTGEDTIINRDNHTGESYNNVVKAAMNKNWAKENSIDSGYSDSVRSSYEEQQRAEKALSLSQQKLEDYHEAKSIIESGGGNSSKDMFEELVTAVSIGEGIGRDQAFRHAERRSSVAERYWNKMNNDNNYVQNLVNDIGKQKQKVSGPKSEKALNDFSNKHESKINSDPASQVKELAKAKGLDVDNAKASMNASKVELSTKHQDITSENDVQRNSIKKANEMDERDIQKKVDKYESNREYMRPGKTLGIGGPNKFEGKDYDYSTKPVDISGMPHQKAKNEKIKK